MALSSFSVVINSLLLKVSKTHQSFRQLPLSLMEAKEKELSPSLWLKGRLGWVNNFALIILIITFTSIFISFASINKTDKFEKSYTLNNDEILTSITKFVTTSKNKINITETSAPKIFLFSEKLPENIKLKS
jgi:hypothetical protein